MDLQFLAEADAVTLQFEKAKRALENAKTELETAKKNYDEMLGKADDMGIPKAKLKKLTEDRIQSLFEIGLLEFEENRTAPKEPKVKKPKAKANRTPDEVAEILTEEDLAKLEAQDALA